MFCVTEHFLCRGGYPGGVEARDDVDLGLSLSVVLRAYIDAATAVFDGAVGGVRGYQVLASAAHHAPPNQLALAQQLGIDRSVLTYLLDDLEAHKLIERRPDPADRRARRIVLTRAGEAALARFGKRLETAERHALRGLDETDQKVLRDLLSRASVSCTGVGESACDVVDGVQKSLDAGAAEAAG
jgi:DNA-binding MarR family transcriptional regulator